MSQQRLDSKVITNIMNTMLSAEPLSGIPKGKQDKVNHLLADMVANMFKAMDNDEKRLDYNLQMDDFTDVLDHAALLFTKVRNQLITLHSERTEYTN
jgi:hypothetical protein